MDEKKECVTKKIMKASELIQKIKSIAIGYSHTDGEHHKQHGLIEIAVLCGAFDEELPDESERGMPS